MEDDKNMSDEEALMEVAKAIQDNAPDQEDDMGKLAEQFNRNLKTFLEAVDEKTEIIKNTGNYIEVESQAEGLSFKAGSVRTGVHELNRMALKSIDDLRTKLKDNGRRPFGVG